MKNIFTPCIQPCIILAICVMLFCQNQAMAQSENSDDNKGVLPSQMVDTRSLSMANTTIADAYGSPSIGINAALSGLSDGQMFIQYNSNHNWGNNLMHHDLTLPTLSHGLHHITTRFGFIHRGFDFLPFTNTGSLPEPDIRTYRAELAYAIAFSENFSLGALQSISYTTAHDNADARYWNYFADIGLVYAPDGPISYGLVFRGLGNDTYYDIIETGLTTLGSQLARQRLEIGITFHYPLRDRTYLSMSFANEKRFGEEGLWYKAGVEIIPVSYIYVRGGVMVNFDQRTFQPRMGLGTKAGMFRFDYMIAPTHLTGNQFHQIGLTIQL